MACCVTFVSCVNLRRAILISVCLSVSPSVQCWYCNETAVLCRQNFYIGMVVIRVSELNRR